VRLSVSITNYSWPDGPAGIAGELDRVAGIADESGLDTLWVADHLLQADPTSTPDSEMLEVYTTLGFLAARTGRVRLGTMVSAVTFREPALLVKAVTTLDVLAGGRARLGIGAGHHDGEARDLGLPFPGTGERFDRLEETLQIAFRMFAGDQSPFEGKHYRLARPVAQPRPLSDPRPSILIGGAGEKRALPLVVKYGDACNLFDIPDGGRTLARKLAVLNQLCEEAGRPANEVEKTVSTRLAPGESAGSFVRRCADLAKLGLDHVVVITSGPWTPEELRTLAEAVPALHELD
jgi:F420-dependent oxidoreductase-like protein